MNLGCNTCMDSCSDRRRLITEIGKIDFILKDLNLYLDTHPYDQQAIEAFRQYNNMKSSLVREHTEKYGPTTLNCLDNNDREWKWALQDWPWERGYY